MKKIFLASALATSLLAPSFVSAAMAEPAAPPAKHEAHKPMGKHHHKGPGAPKGEHGMRGPHHGMRGPHHEMRMAERLAGMETAIGIRSEQLDTWRKYTSSYMDMMDVHPSMHDEKKDGAMFGERMADVTIERAEKAQTFKTAADELRKVLDAAQLKRMEKFAMRPMDEPMGPEHGPAHKHGHKHMDKSMGHEHMDKSMGHESMDESMGHEPAPEAE